MWLQKEITLPSFPRGFHLVTDLIYDKIKLELSQIKVGVAHVFIQHTSASLTINENTDPTVREDFESSLNNLVKENESFYKHTYEGSDDMPAHIKSSLLGNSLNIPITNGDFNLGIWQGIYLCEHRNHAGSRRLVITLQGE